MKRVAIILVIIMCAISFSASSESASAQLAEKYAEAELLLVEGKYDDAAVAFDALGSYSDSSKMAMYCKAISAAEVLKMYPIAIDTFVQLGEFKDCAQLVVYYTGRYNEDAGDVILNALETSSDEDLQLSIDFFTEAKEKYSELALFKDSLSRYSSCDTKISLIQSEQQKRVTNEKEAKYQKALSFEENGQWMDAIAEYETIKDYKDSSERIEVCLISYKKAQYDTGVSLREEQKWDEAVNAFKEAGDYEDAATQISATRYAEGLFKQQGQLWDEAVDAFGKAGDYEDAAEQINATRYKEGLFKQQKQLWDDAITAFQQAGDYSDASSQIIETRYLQAKKLFDETDYIHCYRILVELGEYKDVAQLLQGEELSKAAEHEKKLEPYRTIGNVIKFGKYEQDNKTGNGQEDIEWIVLYAEEDRCLLISKKALDSQPYNTRETAVTWENCSLRKWLNESFYSKAFSNEEKTAIMLSEIDNSAAQCDPNRKTSGGNNTQDYVFLLSFHEAMTYFADDDSRYCLATKYAEEQGACIHEFNGGTCWWLRSPGSKQENALRISAGGNSVDRGVTFGGKLEKSKLVAYDSDSVRPAIWLYLESDYCLK